MVNRTQTIRRLLLSEMNFFGSVFHHFVVTIVSPPHLRPPPQKLLWEQSTNWLGLGSTVFILCNGSHILLRLAVFC